MTSILIGGLLTVAAFSALQSYDELDQDVPFIVWPSLALEWFGLALVGYGLYSWGQGWQKWIGLVAVVGLAASTLLHRSQFDTYVALNAMDIVVYILLGLAVGLPTGQALPVALALVVSLMLMLSKYAILPTQNRLRVVHGPGMALLPVAWGILAYIVMAYAVGSSSGSLFYSAKSQNSLGRMPTSQMPTSQIQIPQTDFLGEPSQMPTTNTNSIQRKSFRNPKAVYGLAPGNVYPQNPSNPMTIM